APRTIYRLLFTFALFQFIDNLRQVRSNRFQSTVRNQPAKHKLRLIVKTQQYGDYFTVKPLIACSAQSLYRTLCDRLDWFSHFWIENIQPFSNIRLELFA